LPDIREYLPSSVSMIEPTMNATPARKKRRSRISAAAARLRINPVIEIAFGVSRDSIRRLRA
jgi:hypothetical protein